MSKETIVALYRVDAGRYESDQGEQYENVKFSSDWIYSASKAFAVAQKYYGCPWVKIFMYNINKEYIGEIWYA